MSVQPTVFLVDDDKAYRQSLRFLLESAGLTVADFPSAPAFLKAYNAAQPGCLVLDVRMPTMSGLELQEYLVEHRVNLPIIFITGHGDVPMSVKAIKGGAVDFIEKPFDDVLLIDRINEAFAKDSENRNVQNKIFDFKSRLLKLTSREQEVMALIIAGRSNKQIATQLDVSHRTVEVHRARIMDKMKAESIAELITMAVTYGVQDLHQ